MQVDAGSYVPASVAFDGRRAYAGVYGNELLCADMVSGKVEWRYGDAENGSPFFSSPAVGADRVLIGSQDRRVHCVGRRDGKRLWTFETRGDVDGSPVICGSKAVFGSADGGLYVVNLSDGGLVWSHGIGSRLSSSPAVADGVIVIGAEDGSVHAFGN
jgi:outer membrane protein assembly factor BamB